MFGKVLAVVFFWLINWLVILLIEMVRLDWSGWVDWGGDRGIAQIGISIR